MGKIFSIEPEEGAICIFYDDNCRIRVNKFSEISTKSSVINVDFTMLVISKRLTKFQFKKKLQRTVIAALREAVAQHQSVKNSE